MAVREDAYPKKGALVMEAVALVMADFINANTDATITEQEVIDAVSAKLATLEDYPFVE